MTAPRRQHTTWHANQYVDGAMYPTRHHTYSDCGDKGSRYLELPAESTQEIRAIHEAAHAVVALVGGAHLHHAQIEASNSTGDTGGVTYVCGFADRRLFGAYCAAGERADDRWLREEGLWTPRRAVCVEIGARGDRQTLLAFSPHVGFGDKEIHFRAIHDLADEVIDAYWAQITTVAALLVERMCLDGNEISSLSGLEGAACVCGQGAPLKPAHGSWWRRVLKFTANILDG